MAAEADAGEVVEVRLTYDVESDVAYIAFEDIGPGEAEYQEIVKNPVEGGPEIVLDFDREGRLLGVEFLGAAALPAPLVHRIATTGS